MSCDLTKQKSLKTSRTNCIIFPLSGASKTGQKGSVLMFHPSLWHTTAVLDFIHSTAFGRAFAPNQGTRGPEMRGRRSFVANEP